MADSSFNWTCPFCGHATTITGPNHQHFGQGLTAFDDRSVHGRFGCRVAAVLCPNKECRQVQLYVHVSKYLVDRLLNWLEQDFFESHRIWPESLAKPQPDCVPPHLADAYRKACRIRDLAPEASAAMSRRCLQGMIRDFWKVNGKKTLAQEIDEIEGKVDPTTWEAIDAVRKVGNIGAHFNEDVDRIVEVDPGEAQVLIGLIEMLFRDWYVLREDRRRRTAAVLKLGAEKQKLIDDAKKPKAAG